MIDGKWDMIIGFPPCTYLSNVGTRHFSLKHTPAEKVAKRWELRAEAAVFFMRLALADCEKVSIENPIGFMNRAYRKPNQIIEPWQFVNSTETDEYRTKKTCLWLRGLPELHRTGNLERPQPVGYWINKYGKKKNLNWEDGVSKKDSKFRSKTPSGIAKAMAEQWG